VDPVALHEAKAEGERDGGGSAVTDEWERDPSNWGGSKVHRDVDPALEEDDRGEPTAEHCAEAVR
jgi:hypothetical protein